MSTGQHLNVTLRSRKLVLNAAGYNMWEVAESPASFACSESAILLCDVWDKHWCRGADERLAKLLPRMNHVVKALRNKGVLVVHAPSDTMQFYAGTPARQRVLDALKLEPPADLPHDDPPLPVHSSDSTCDTDNNTCDTPVAVWSRQHQAIEIDPNCDAISDDGTELYNLYRQRRIKNILIMGVHTNICVLGRSFAIKQMVRWGFNVALVRDLTDTMYNPATPPYVSHEEGTRLTIEYIEKFWCPTLSSEVLVKGP